MHEPFAICNWLVILFTGVFSYLGFADLRFQQRYIFQPERILADKEYYRLLSSAFLHADWYHLTLNMMSLYFFGRNIELFLGVPQFLAIYLGGIVGGNLLSLWIHRHHDYRAYGASGGVCGVIFASIFLFPGGSISVFPLPLSVPSWLYAIGFMLGSFYGLRGRRDSIGHDAHMGGAICGLLVTAALRPWIVRLSPTLFAAVLLLSALIFAWLLTNPLLLADGAGFTRWFSRRALRPSLPKYKQDELRVDELLERVSRKGIESLSAEEKVFLNQASGKFRRRAESKKPESGLIF